MIKDFNTYISEGLFNRNQSEFGIQKTDKGIEQIYTPKTKDGLYEYIDIAIEKAKKDGTYPNVNLNNIDVSELGNNELNSLFGGDNYKQIIPDISNWNIKYIPSRFFSRNEQIKEFTIPNSVTSIEDYAFYTCSGLKSVVIPNSVNGIGIYAFSLCDGLTSVTIPNNVTTIGEDTFWGCTSLTSINIPDSVTSIRGGAVSSCSGLKSVIIGNGVTNIGYHAFYNCINLTSVEIPNSVTSIREDAFEGCINLTSVTISKHCRIKNSFQKNCKIIRKDD